MSLCCENDSRRDAVRRMSGRNGLDYVEVGDDERTLYAYFLGKLPDELRASDASKYLKVEGGQRVTGIGIVSVEAVVEDNPERDDHLVVKLSGAGDFSTYSLVLSGIDNIDPRYDRVEFSFKVNCPSDLDCAPVCDCAPSLPAEPEINYLAKDYGSFRQLILDRLAVLMPDWQERHAADLGIALVEVLAYVGDSLSYYQDAVATEAYLGTARQRISVRRHARLVDYVLHEGCNARAWLAIESSEALELDADRVSFITGLNDVLPARQTILTQDDLRETSSHAYEVFEPFDRSSPLRLNPARNEIHFYTWAERECCLARGSTTATLLDGSGELNLQPGDVLIFEEVIGPVTGLPADADPDRRHAVLLTKTAAGEDPLTGSRYVDIEWAAADALPFTLCISAIGAAPGCRYVQNISVARGNVILADHGRTVAPEDLGTVPLLKSEAECDCEGRPGEVTSVAGRFGPHLRHAPLTWRESIAAGKSAKSMVMQDPRLARPQLTLSSVPAREWQYQPDLFASRSDDAHYVVETNNERVSRIRFGDGECGCPPAAETTFSAAYRIGSGTAGNVGADSISRMVLRDLTLSGVSIVVRNPLPASGGVDPESVADAKLMAPHHFRKRLERAITWEDYESIAERNANVQRASASLVWTGSWYDVDVALDPRAGAASEEGLLAEVERYLELYRRMGHDVHVERARYVPLDLKLEVCALPGYERAQVKRELLDVFSNRMLGRGRLGFFHPDRLTFGEEIHISRIVAAAQAVTGVECATVTRLQRLYEAPNHEIESGVLELSNQEIARLDNDPGHPERGRLEIVVGGGR